MTVVNSSRVFAWLVVVAIGASVGCEDPPAPAAPPGAPASGAPTASVPPPPPPLPEAPAVATVVEERTLTDEDFAESLDNNRDPFRSYLSAFATPVKKTIEQTRNVLLSRYGLDELKLIAVVTGPVRAMAMFKDPTGLGVSVKRGDWISKNHGMIKQILPNKVVVQLAERSEDTQRMADRVIDLHPRAEREKELRVE